ncbi:MAG: Smr/MutS family protein [Georgfuchsia sp.]
MPSVFSTHWAASEAGLKRPKSKLRPPPGDDELALFRTAVADVVPIENTRVNHEPDPPPAIPRQRELDEAAALLESLHGAPLIDLYLEGGDEAAWSRTGVPHNVLRDLRRGRWAISAYLDLHGHTRDEARMAFNQFIAECQSLGKRCVRIVHGKGLGSPGREPVLKRLVLGWLTQKAEVLAFCQARTADGGAGAVMVLLRAAKK